ncbi:MAG: hypothetical protein ACRD6R_07585 [Candidatus Polarisedimenticolia bacterium]
MTGSKDLYEQFELEVRTPKKRLLLDAFLPDPAALPSAVTPPAPPPPVMSPEEAQFFARREERDEEPPPEPKPRRKAKAAPPKRKEAPKTLQEEIAEFMNRDGSSLAPDEEIESPPKTSLDPKTDRDGEK